MGWDGLGSAVADEATYGLRAGWALVSPSAHSPWWPRLRRREEREEKRQKLKEPPDYGRRLPENPSVKGSSW